MLGVGPVSVAQPEDGGVAHMGRHIRCGGVPKLIVRKAHVAGLPLDLHRFRQVDLRHPLGRAFVQCLRAIVLEVGLILVMRPRPTR